MQATLPFRQQQQQKLQRVAMNCSASVDQRSPATMLPPKKQTCSVRMMSTHCQQQLLLSAACCVPVVMQCLCCCCWSCVLKLCLFILRPQTFRLFRARCSGTCGAHTGCLAVGSTDINNLCPVCANLHGHDSQRRTWVRTSKKILR